MRFKNLSFLTEVNPNQKTKEELAKHPENWDKIKQLDLTDLARFGLACFTVLGVTYMTCSSSKNYSRQEYLESHNNGRRRKYLD